MSEQKTYNLQQAVQFCVQSSSDGEDLVHRENPEGSSNESDYRVATSSSPSAESDEEYKPPMPVKRSSSSQPARGGQKTALRSAPGQPSSSSAERFSCTFILASSCSFPVSVGHQTDGPRVGGNPVPAVHHLTGTHIPRQEPSSSDGSGEKRQQQCRHGSRCVDLQTEFCSSWDSAPLDVLEIH